MTRHLEEFGGDWLKVLGSLLIALAILALIFLAYGPDEPGPRATCSTITLSTPDGKRCFPKHRDRSMVRPLAGDSHDEVRR